MKLNIQLFADDEISVSLGLDTSKFLGGLQNALGNFNKFTSNIGKKNKVEVSIDTDKLIKRAELEKVLSDYKSILNNSEVGSDAFKESVIEIDKIKKEINALDNDGKEIEKTTDNIINKTSVIGGLIRRIGLSIRRQIITKIAYILNPLNMFRKSFSYLTDVLTPRLGATFKNIGNNLTEYFAGSSFFQNLIHQGLYLIYILQTIFNVIAKIFGFKQIDLFKKSTKTAKQLEKSASKITASFDELNDISSNGGNGDMVPLSVGELFSDEEIEKAEKIAESIKKPFETLKTIFDKIKDHLWEILVVIGLIVIAIKIFSGGGSGLNKLQKGLGDLFNGLGKAVEIIAILGGLALVLKSLSTLIDSISKSNMEVSDIVILLAGVFGSIILLMLALTKLGPELTGALIPFGLLMAEVSAILIVLALTLPTILNSLGDFIERVGPIVIDILNTIKDIIESIIYAIDKTLSDTLKSIGDLFTTIFKGVENVINSVANAIVNILKTVDKTVSNVFKSILNFIYELGPAINTLVDNIIVALRKLFNFFTKGFETIVNNGVTAFNWLLSPLRDLGNDVLSLIGVKNFKFKGMSKLSGLAYLDTGTNYVPNDQLAMIHQGEAVIPKKFNEKEYFGGGNEETNSLLETLIDRVDNLELSPYISVKDIGQASVDYINNKSRITGRSVI